MDRNIAKSHLGIVIMLGAVWGLSEAALGMGLRSCASFLSGSIMTGVALFFISASWVLTRRILGIALLIAVTSLFKMFDALLLSLRCGISCLAHHLPNAKAQNRQAGCLRRNSRPSGRESFPSGEIRDRRPCLCLSRNGCSPFSVLCSAGRFYLLYHRSPRILGRSQDFSPGDKTRGSLCRQKIKIHHLTRNSSHLPCHYHPHQTRLNH